MKKDIFILFKNLKKIVLNEKQILISGGGTSS
jgi:hypothetical protein